MWIISKSIVKKLLDMLNGNFANIEKQLTLNREVRVHTARRLISLRKNLESYNKQVHQEYELLCSTNNENSRLSRLHLITSI